jgi:hypothetical protein
MGPTPLLDRSERAARTCSLLAAAAAPRLESSRRALLLEVAALNLDVAAVIAASLCDRVAGEQVDRPALLEHARAAYVDAVLDLDLPVTGDFVARIAPPVRDAIREYLRSTQAEIAHTSTHEGG